MSYSFADVDGVENEAYNTDTFESPETVYWQAYKGTKELVSQAHVKYTQTGPSGFFQTQFQMLHTSSNKFYIKWKARSTNAVTFHSSTNQKAFVSDGKWYLMGKIMNGISAGTAIFRAEPSTNGYVEIKDFMLIDLTKKYGSGNEPTFEECENMFGDVWVPRDSGGTDLDKNFIIKSYDESNQLLGKFDSSENSRNVRVVGGGKFVITYADVKPNYIRLDNVKYREIVKESADLGVNVVSLHNVDRLLFVGDSYTEGIYYIKGKSWTSLLSEQLDYTCDGYGWGGNTCEQIANRIIGNEARYSPLGYHDLKPTRAMLMSFVNDMAQNSQYSHIYQQGMEKLVKAVRQYGAEPIVCTEFRAPWGEGLQSGMSAYCAAYNVRFWNILPYTSFLNNKTASDGADDRFWAGSHPGSRTGYIILDNYLRYCRTLPRPNSAIKIYRVKPTVTVNSLNDLHFTSLRDKLTKFKEIYISHSSLVNSAQWDSVTTNDGVLNPVISEYAKLMNGENINLGDYALVEVVVPTTSNNVSSAKLLLSDDSVEIYAKTTNSFTLLSNGEIAKSNGYVEYDKMTFLLHKEGGIILNDVRLEWVGQEAEKTLPLPHTINKKGTELLPNNKVDDTSWLTTYGTITPKVPNDNVLPTGCTKCIEVNDKNYVEITSPNNNVVGTMQKNKLRVACRYNPVVGSAEVNENSYDYKELEIKFYGCNSAGKTRTYYTTKKDVGMYWTLVEVEFESNDSRKIIIKSSDATDIEVAYISILEM